MAGTRVLAMYMCYLFRTSECLCKDCNSSRGVVLGAIVVLRTPETLPDKRLAGQGVAATRLGPATSSINIYPTPFSRSPAKRGGPALSSLRIQQ